MSTQRRSDACSRHEGSISRLHGITDNVKIPVEGVSGLPGAQRVAVKTAAAPVDTVPAMVGRADRCRSQRKERA